MFMIMGACQDRLNSLVNFVLEEPKLIRKPLVLNSTLTREPTIQRSVSVSYCLRLCMCNLVRITAYGDEVHDAKQIIRGGLSPRNI